MEKENKTLSTLKGLRYVQRFSSYLMENKPRRPLRRTVFLMLFKEIIGADCGKCRKQIRVSTLRGKIAEFLNFIEGGTYHDHWAFNG
jgi:hypothetical protein